MKEREAVGLYHRVLAHPFVYDRIRPRFVGGIDFTELYAGLDANARRHVLDVGCGTGDALRYISGFESYLGVDTEPAAIETARARFGNRPGVRFECRTVVREDIEHIAPTGVLLTGVLHHLTNEQAREVFRLAMCSPRLARVLTADIVFVPGLLFNNAIAMMDRGRHCRHPDAYASLARSAGLEVSTARIMAANPKKPRVHYFAMALEPNGVGRVPTA